SIRHPAGRRRPAVLLCSGSDLRVLLDGNARADQVTVAGGALDEADGRPEFPFSRPWRREGGTFAAVRVRPLVGADHVRRMRRALQQVVGPVGDADLDLADLLADGDQRIAEPVELLERLALG